RRGKRRMRACWRASTKTAKPTRWGIDTSGTITSGRRPSLISPSASTGSSMVRTLKPACVSVISLTLSMAGSSSTTSTSVVIGRSLTSRPGRSPRATVAHGSGIAPRGRLLIVHQGAELDASGHEMGGAELDVYDHVVTTKRVQEVPQPPLEVVVVVRTDQLELGVHLYNLPRRSPTKALVPGGFAGTASIDDMR